MRTYIPVVVLAMMAVAITTSPAAADDADVERGRYLVTIGGCNDCHTAGYPESGGQVPESDWLIGVPVGFSGPWGTSYASNLRLLADRMNEEQFAARARSRLLPPMPWFNVVKMSDDDLGAMYRYIRSLGPAGTATPAYVPPGETPNTPYIVFVPQMPAGAVAAN